MYNFLVCTKFLTGKMCIFSLCETVDSSKEVQTLKADETDLNDSVGFGSPKKHDRTNESLNLTLVDRESNLTFTNSPVPRSVSDNISGGCNKNVKNFAPQENYYACSHEEFNTSVIGGLFANHSDNSNINKEDLVIPSGRLPFTSTQVASPRDLVQSQIFDTKTISNGYFVSALTLSNLDHTQSNDNTQITMESTPGTLNPLAKRGKSLSLTMEESKTDESERKDKETVETSISCFEDFCKFRYIDVSSKSSVSPLKGILEKEIKEKNSQNCTVQSDEKSKRSHDNVLETSIPRKILKPEATYPDNLQFEGEASVYNEGACSPQLFYSDDELYQDDAHVENMHKAVTQHEKSSVVKNKYRKKQELKVYNATPSKDVHSTPKSTVVTSSRKDGCNSESKRRAIEFGSCANGNCGKRNSGKCILISVSYNV